MNPKPEYIYVAFDVFPSQKGAATHIDHCLKALQRTFKTGLLICLGNDPMPTFQYDEARHLYVYRWKEKVVNFLERTQKFQNAVSNLLRLPLCETVNLVHFRDIWGGLPVLQHIASYKTVFEVNAFSHIELPNRYPTISRSVLNTIQAMEQFCLDQCDAIMTPSEITQNHLSHQFKTNREKILVIPNGVTIYEALPLEKNDISSSPFILYFGALQKWQGIKTLFKAFKELTDLDVRLRICTSVPKKRTTIQKELATSIGIAHRIDWYYELDKSHLAAHIQQATLTVAPLSACDRNIVQGCNPLKILESMAYGIPVVASDIPVVRALIDKDTGFLVAPDRPETLGRTIRALLESPDKISEVGQNAKQKIKNKYLWEDQEAKMISLYQNLLSYV